MKDVKANCQPHARAWLSTAALLLCVPAYGADDIEQLVVTATKRESALQDTAVAISAFDQTALSREGIDDALDVQFSVPNMHFTKANFSQSSLTIRGIGRSVVAVSGDSGTGVHFNGAYLHNSTIFESEFFDVERIEILRGPQGTLYGRNTTAGVVNILPAKPTNDFDASLMAELGSDEMRRLRGMVNVPINDFMNFRLAGMMLQRDGYTENLFTGDNIDDRDLWALRGTFGFRLGDDTDLYLTYQTFEEDDKRMRTSKQHCAKDTQPFPFSLGCEPNADIDSPGVVNSQAQLGGILPAIINLGGTTLIPFGDDHNADSFNSSDPRKVNTDFEPVYAVDEDLFTAELSHQLGDLTLDLQGSRHDLDYLAETDFDWTVPSGTFTPNIPGFTDADGVISTPMDPSVGGRSFNVAYDTSAYQSRTYTAEARLTSDYLDSPWDFLAGAFWMDHRTDDAIYDVHATGLAFVAAAPELAFFRNHVETYDLDTWAAFGELYYDWTDATRLTLGLRYTDEEKFIGDRQTLLNNPSLSEIPGVSNRPFLNDPAQSFQAAFLAGAGVMDPLFAGFSAAGNNPVPSFREFSEEWNELTGRFGIEHDLELGFTDATMVFANAARSYKSGGINPPSSTGAFEPTFDPEFINSVELGAKNRLLDGRMQLNATYFFYDYEGLQTTKIIDRTSVNENIDAKIQGLELEAIATPTENIRIDSFISLLDTEITDGNSVNSANPANGDPTWLPVKNNDGSIYLAPIGDRTFTPSDCAATVECATVFEENPLTSGLGADTPTVQVPIGVPVQLAGRELPNAPNLTFKLGLEYSFRFANGMELVPRFDYYYHADFFYRIYNTAQDEVDGWDVMNATATLFGPDANWTLKAYVKNIKDDDFITGAFFTDASSGNFTNTFVLEPRTYGLALSYRF